MSEDKLSTEFMTGEEKMRIFVTQGEEDIDFITGTNKVINRDFGGRGAAFYGVHSSFNDPKFRDKAKSRLEGGTFERKDMPVYQTTMSIDFELPEFKDKDGNCYKVTAYFHTLRDRGRFAKQDMCETYVSFGVKGRFQEPLYPLTRFRADKFYGTSSIEGLSDAQLIGGVVNHLSKSYMQSRVIEAFREAVREPSICDDPIPAVPLIYFSSDDGSPESAFSDIRDEMTLLEQQKVGPKLFGDRKDRRW